MKNIHVIATDKPSRLVKNHKNLLKLCIQTLPLDREINCFPQNIYITSDGDILRGQWYFSESLNMVLQYTQDELLSPRELKENGDKKIILTTDQDLIKDGVQAIDDKFVEWFCKNPNCEEVKTLKFADSVSTFTYRIAIPEQDKWEQLRGAGLDQPLTHWNEPKQNELDPINYADELINNEKDDKTLNHILTSHMIPQEYFSKKQTLEEDSQDIAIRFLEWYRRKNVFFQFHAYHIPNPDDKNWEQTVFHGGNSYLTSRQLFVIFKKEVYE